jgi:hypothetical protein
LADCGADTLDGSCGGLTQQVLELGEDLFDGVQVWRVFRQEEQFGASRADEFAHGRDDLALAGDAVLAPGDEPLGVG